MIVGALIDEIALIIMNIIIIIYNVNIMIIIITRSSWLNYALRGTQYQVVPVVADLWFWVSIYGDTG